jgi:prepilin-type N-terminal cleavage/methylation domain-containing protein
MSIDVSRNASNRPGFTLVETMIALGVLTTAAVLAAQLGAWSLIERGRTEDRLVATDAAANILEAARARGWAELTPEWAAGQRLTDPVAARLNDGTLAVRVTPEQDRPHVKRVTVLIEWGHQPSIPPRTVSLAGLFAERAAGGGT